MYFNFCYEQCTSEHSSQWYRTNVTVQLCLSCWCYTTMLISTVARLGRHRGNVSVAAIMLYTPCLKTSRSYFSYNFVIHESILIIFGMRVVWEISIITVRKCFMFSFTAKNQLKMLLKCRRQLDAKRQCASSLHCGSLWYIYSGFPGSWDTAFYWSQTFCLKQSGCEPRFQGFGPHAR